MARTPRRTPVTDPQAEAIVIVERVRALGSEENRAGMSRYGINVDEAFGVSVATLRDLGKPYRGDHALAAALWETGFHEARLLAALVDDPAQVTPAQMESWALGFDSWDLTDQAATSLFDVSPYGWEKAREWSSRPEEFVKRAGFALMAGLASHDRAAPDERFVELLPLAAEQASDGRNYVKKAVSWALRNIGKRNAALNARAAATAEEILADAGDGRDPESRSARWVAKDVLRELTSEPVRRRLGLDT